jgi:hypothetical protein
MKVPHHITHWLPVAAPLPRFALNPKPAAGNLCGAAEFSGGGGGA